eukprot:9388857-Alexandrium_andersonii.AAC.1
MVIAFVLKQWSFRYGLRHPEQLAGRPQRARWAGTGFEKPMAGSEVRHAVGCPGLRWADSNT